MRREKKEFSFCVKKFTVYQISLYHQFIIGGTPTA
jgi:hypothetical protein